MENLYYSIILFFIIYLLYYLLLVKSKKRLAKFKKSTEIEYLVNKYKIKIEEYNITKLANLLSLINSFIVAVVFLAVSFFDKIYISLIAAFILIFPLIIIIYGIVGKKLKKGLFKTSKRGKQNV